MATHVNNFIRDESVVTLIARHCMDNISVTVEIRDPGIGTDQVTFFAPDEKALDFACSLRAIANKIEMLVEERQPQQKEVANA